MSNALSQFVDEWPVVTDHPWRKLLSEEYEIRRGTSFGRPELAIWAPKHQMHVAVSEADFDEESEERLLRPMMLNLTGAIFEKLYPGQFMEMIRDKTERIAKGNWEKSPYHHLWAEHERISSWGPAPVPQP